MGAVYLIREEMGLRPPAEYPGSISSTSFVGGFDATNLRPRDVLDQVTESTRVTWGVRGLRVWFDEAQLTQSDHPT